jgi:hypothetical protein
VADDDKIPCPECGKLVGKGYLPLHRAQQHKAAKSRELDKTPIEADVRAAVIEAEQNLVMVGAVLTTVAPHLGLTIAGLPSADWPSNRPVREAQAAGKMVVRSRAVLAGTILEAHARRNARILELILRFNGLFRGSVALEVGASLAAAAAADAGVDPQFTLAVPLLGLVRPIPLVIGDVLDEMSRQEAEFKAQQAQAERDGQAPPAAVGRPAGVTVEGGVTQT